MFRFGFGLIVFGWGRGSQLGFRAVPPTWNFEGRAGQGFDAPVSFIHLVPNLHQSRFVLGGWCSHAPAHRAATSASDLGAFRAWRQYVDGDPPLLGSGRCDIPEIEAADMTPVVFFRDFYSQ